MLPIFTIQIAKLKLMGTYCIIAKYEKTITETGNMKHGAFFRSKEYVTILGRVAPVPLLGKY